MISKISADLIIAAVLGIPVGGLVAFLLTPLLWELEPVVHMELAGHSGPAETVIIASMIFAVLMIFTALRLIRKFRRTL